MTGGTHTRLERIEFLGRYPDLVNNVRVCWQHLDEGINCGVCEKCVRTRLEMMIFGLEPKIFNEPMSGKYIEALTFENSTQFKFFEEIYLNFPKDNPYYEWIEKIYKREKKKNDPCEARLEIKESEIRRLEDEITQMKNTKSYKITKPLRYIRKFLK
ncbi:hypothetical protein SDC9_184123 [bioreactor metagenome]|uniref:Uncharacterized protein n=1 Tax=bioreactor metagenome TaxID=1076179 RepID=A0A645HM47_9ZZZZ